MKKTGFFESGRAYIAPAAEMIDLGLEAGLCLILSAEDEELPDALEDDWGTI